MASQNPLPPICGALIRQLRRPASSRVASSTRERQAIWRNGRFSTSVGLQVGNHMTSPRRRPPSP
eukprot:6557124-Prorocentrum_lima.AAC.1